MSSNYNKPIQNSDRSQRSVFVGNISYDVPEDTIRTMFSQVGPVISLKMVHDRETGKPKGYGFIEYPEVQMAESAIRNLNGHELSGRPLRVDSAAGGMNTMEEFNNAHAASVVVEESSYGSECDASKAPEVISKAVVSLPPEKMFELMTQMKDVVRSNSNEVKKMLTSNPQLAYALLQAQVVMRIVDPQTAMALLHRETPSTMKPFHLQGGAKGPMPPAQIPFNIPPSTSLPPQQVHSKPLQPVLPQQYNNYTKPGGPPQHPHQQFQGGPPMQQGPPQQPPQQQQNHGQGEITREEQQNAELLMQVMQLSEHDLQMLPEEDRGKIIELRNQLRRNVK